MWFALEVNTHVARAFAQRPKCEIRLSQNPSLTSKKVSGIFLLLSAFSLPSIRFSLRLRVLWLLSLRFLLLSLLPLNVLLGLLGLLNLGCSLLLPLRFLSLGLSLLLMLLNLRPLLILLLPFLS